MKKNLDGTITYSPSDLILFMESEVTTWLDRYNLEFPNQLILDDTDDSLSLLQKLGNVHESNYLAFLKAQNLDVCEIDSDPSQKLTLQALQSGHDIIYQAHLSHQSFAGKADFLRKISSQDSTNVTGDFQYQVLDTKLSLSPKPYFIIQLCCYAEMLQSMQGTLASHIGIILGDGTLKEFKTNDYYFYYQKLKSRFLKFQAEFDPKIMPPLMGHERLGRWTKHIDTLLEQSDHLCNVANISSRQISLLQESGIDTIEKLAHYNGENPRGIANSSFAKLRQQAFLQKRSVGKDIPEFIVLEPDLSNTSVGLPSLPPSSPLDVCFDMEGYPHLLGGLEYLFGVTYLENDSLLFLDWWAHDQKQEQIAFEQFIDWVYERFTRDSNMHVYHYAAYEVSAIRKLMGRYGTREEQVDQLLRNNVFIDLFSIVRHSLQVGEPRYSIKNIEHLYMEKRGSEVSKATDSVIFYEKWLTEKDGNDWRSSKILKSIRDYNKEDCDSTWLLLKWLREIQNANKIGYVPHAKKEQSDDSAQTESLALAAQIFTNPPAHWSDEQLRVGKLLAHLLHFYKRESKTFWWSFFDRLKMNEQELFDDPECLSTVKRTKAAPVANLRSHIYQFSFDPEQDTKLHTGSTCKILSSVEESKQISIHSFDKEKGLLTLKATVEPPAQFNLIPFENYRAGQMEKQIFSLTSNFVANDTLPPALNDILFRNKPSIKNHVSGADVIDSLLTGEARMSAYCEAVSNLENSYLCIQGPPGAGKTFTAAEIIFSLLKQNKKIGITANSHSVINNLFNSVINLCKRNSLNIDAYRILASTTDDAGLSSDDMVKVAVGGGKFFASDTPFSLVGGTVYAFSAESANHKLDYLFIDEASQVSLANLVSMSQCSRNLILVGDQMQLGQPIKGTHPGESGQSALQYIIADDATISSDMGIFLDITWRLHPTICKFISDTMYDSRLHSNVENIQRVLRLSGEAESILRCNYGLVYLPVMHDNNRHSSNEECEAIRFLIQKLEGSFVFDAKLTTDHSDGFRRLEHKDILVVSPYNMQIRKLKSILPDGIAVGTVDKFQGLEAAVAIISMCASDPEDFPRGLSFLFSKNRLNVAVSRAQTMAIVVGSPKLIETNCNSIEQMSLLNVYCQLIAQSTQISLQ